MLTIPLYVALFIYFGFLLFFISFIFINLTHLFHTGTLTFFSFIITLFFLAFSVIVLWATWYSLRDVNWQQPIISWNFSLGNNLNLPSNGGL